MPWDERQRAMLREMGIRLWVPGALDGASSGADRLGAEPSAVPAQTQRAAPATAGSAVAVERPRAAPTRPSGPATSAATAAATAPATALAPTPASAPTTRLTTAAGPVDALGWAALRETVAACTACKLCEGRRQTVFGVGHERAHWMIVGEAPGEQEDRQGEPFVGKSGQLLDAMLAAIKLTRAEAEPARQVYIANTVKCRPPGNRNPEPAELAQCEPFLVRQVQLVQPKIIVAMGRFAVQAPLRSSEPIGRLRGRVHRYEGVPLIVTYHPAYLLRNPQDKAKAWDDLCLAVETASAV